MSRYVDVNLNCIVRVKLTEYGKEIYRDRFKGDENIYPKVDEEGYTEFILWYFMEIYGSYLNVCSKAVIEDLSLRIDVKDLNLTDEIPFRKIVDIWNKGNSAKVSNKFLNFLEDNKIFPTHLVNSNDNGDSIPGYSYKQKSDIEGVPYIHIDSVRRMLKETREAVIKELKNNKMED